MSSNMESINFDYLFCLFKGEVGTRKSTSALSFPRPQYWFSWDQKMEGLYIPMKNWGINPKEVEFDDYKDWNAVRIKLEQLQVNCKYKSLIIDTITTGSDAINRQTLKIKSGEKGEMGKKIAGIPVNSIEDFNAEDSALKELVALLKDIHKYHKVNVILIAHVIQKEIKTSEGKTHMSRVLVTAGKSIAQKIPAYCGEVYHFNIKPSLQGGGQYTCLTTHTGDDFARTSLPLKEEINFGNEPLYDKWIAPAIATTKINPVLVNSFEVKK